MASGQVVMSLRSLSARSLPYYRPAAFIFGPSGRHSSIFFTCENAIVFQNVLLCVNEREWNVYCHCCDSNRSILFAHSTMHGSSDPVKWYTCPCTLNVGIQPSSLHFRVAPSDVILSSWRFVRKSFESSCVPASSDANGSGAAGSGGRTTLPLAQHVPGGSCWNFRAWQCWHLTDMDPIKSVWSAE